MRQISRRARIISLALAVLLSIPVAACRRSFSAWPGEAVGRLRLSLPRVAVPFVIDPLLATFRARHPRVEVELVVEDRLVDIVAGGYDAGIRLSEIVDRDMVQVRLTEPARFVVVGKPEYLARHGTRHCPRGPRQQLRVPVLPGTVSENGRWYFEHDGRTPNSPRAGSADSSSAGLAC